MKVAIIKLGARICDNVENGNSTNEVLSLIKMLTEANVECHAFTKKLKKDLVPDYFFIHDLIEEFESINDYEMLFIVNGNVNYFGGQDDPYQTWNYKIINKFKGPCVYMLYDPLLPFKQVWKSIEKKKWASEYNKEDVLVEKDLLYITQCKNTDKLKNSLINVKDVVYYPLEKFPLMTSELSRLETLNLKYDLFYPGNFRNGRRRKSMLEYFFNFPDTIKVDLIGNTKLSDFKEKELLNKTTYPTFNSPVSHTEVENLIKKSLATVIIGDEEYIRLNDVAQRAYESIILGNVTFIDTRYDFEKRVYSGLINAYKDFLYVSSGKELFEKVEILKKYLDFAKRISSHVQDYILESFNKKDYCNNLVKIVEANV